MARNLVEIEGGTGDAGIDKPKLHDPDYEGDIWFALEWTPPPKNTSAINVYDEHPHNGGNLIGGLGPQSIYESGVVTLQDGPVAEVYFEAGTEATSKIYSWLVEEKGPEQAPKVD